VHCNKDFLARPQLKYLRPKPYQLSLALFLKFSAQTYNQIADFLWQFQGVLVAQSTLHDWIANYGPCAADVLADVHIPLAGFLYVDEMCESIRIQDEHGNWVRTDSWWIVNVYDPVNDVWRVGLVSRTRDANLAYEILDRIVTLFTKDKQCYKLFVKSDGLDIYEQARDKLAREGSLDPARIVLISIPKQSENPHVTTDRAFINDIERFHTFVRALTRRMRRLKVFLSESAPQKWVDTARVHYNAVQTIRNPDGSRTTRIQNALPGFGQARNRWLAFIMQVLNLRKHAIEIKAQTRKAIQRAAEQRTSNRKSPKFRSG
jgi:transposase-like protein